MIFFPFRSDNRLVIPEKPSVLSKAFQQLTTLFMNRCAYNWAQVHLQIS